MTALTAPLPGDTAARPAPLRILIADDFPAARVFLTRHLARLGYGCDEAEDGAQAITAMNTNPYDLVLLDLSMPNVDGLAVIQWLRSGACPHPAPHIAVISALALESKPALAALDVHTLLPKPVARAELAALLSTLTAQGSSATMTS